MAWRVSGRTDLPLASRDRGWDAPAAEGRVRSWAGGPDKESINWSKFRQAFFAYDDEGEGFGAYKLPFADVIDGSLRAVPRGVFAAAGGWGVNQADVPEAVRAAIRSRITSYYNRMRREFDDEEIRSPFEERALGPVMETKAIVDEFRLVEDRMVTGFASVFGILDDGGDIVEPGAYAKTLQERGPRLRWLWQHDRTQPPIARVVEIAEVGAGDLPEAMRAKWTDASGGLLVKREYLDTPRGNEVLAGIRSGAIAEMSIGYDPIKAEYPDSQIVGGRPVRRKLQEIRLWEMSDVLWGMNAATANVKDLLSASSDELIERLREAGRWDEVLNRAQAEIQAAQAAEAKERERRRAEVERRRRRVEVMRRRLEIG